MIDDREGYTPGWKFNEWEMKGIPLRLEIGPKDIVKKQVVLVRRDNSQKSMVKENAVEKVVGEILEAIQDSLYKKAKDFLNKNIASVKSYDEFKKILEAKGGFIKTSWCEGQHCENQIKVETGATIRIIPFVKEKVGKCIYCNKDGKRTVFFAKAY